MTTCIWITGLSGSGKTTLAGEVAERLRRRGLPVVVLDGDELRELFRDGGGDSAGHHREARLDLAMRYARLCRMLVQQGFTVIIATISLFREVHSWNRANVPGYFELYLKVPLEELRRRDPKGIYRRFDSGELAEVAGLDVPVDEPREPDWIVEFDPARGTAILADELLERLKGKGIT